ncbi:MAG: anaerobic sulfite reductase subunit AsrB, partial [Peptostreptococcus sp.]|nr:anaerobic sulfite reductase subunit AsrB [Peptostreptococcus sp.]
DDGSYGQKGVVTVGVEDIIKREHVDRVLAIGPPMMMKFAVAEFLKLNMAESNIWVSYERRMHCGIGKCGHCKMDSTYICLDGPVFSYDFAKNLVD